MFLGIDVGNTRLKWALYEGAHPGAAVLAHGAEFLENIDKLADGSWRDLPEPTRMLGCCVAGDAIKVRVAEQMEELWDVTPRWVHASTAEAGLTNGYDHPSRLGADRWVAMIGAWHRMLSQGPVRPLVLAMVGTAVTVEAIDMQGRFLGGFILPILFGVLVDLTGIRSSAFMLMYGVVWVSLIWMYWTEVRSREVMGANAGNAATAP